MAITKITNIGENSGAGSRAAHLKNALKYIMNPKKTEGMTLVGSNCGTDPQECFERMMETKEIYGKTGGRQGYHIVISFKPGECNEETAMVIARDFCDQYLAGDYDYAFAVHNDQAHMHIHIVFNSVNRSNTLKYHYSNGDWEKSIQPITDELCRKYGLSILECDKSAPRVGRTYAEHMAEKNGKLTWTDIIQADIDFAISQTSTESDFMAFMKSMGYSIRIGHSGKYGEYAAYTAPGESDRNRDRTRRDYKLGEDYRLTDIRKRLAAPDKALPESPPPFEPVAYAAGLLAAEDSEKDVASENSLQHESLGPNGRLRGRVLDDLRYSAPGRPLTKFQVVFVRRVWLANNFRFLILREDEQARARQDALRLQNLTEQCDYILQHGITTLIDAENRLAVVKAAIAPAREAGDTAVLDALLQEKRILRRIIKGYDGLNYEKDRAFREDILFANTEKRLEYQEKRKKQQRQREKLLEKEQGPVPLQREAKQQGNTAKVPTDRGFAGSAGPNETINPYVKKKE